jgi:4-alpha-glucanotransferase
VKEDPLRWGWPAWPEDFQSTDSPEVKAFCESHADEVNFYLWLQWLAYTQFAECWQESQSHTCQLGCTGISPWALPKAVRKPGAIASCTA